MSGFRISRMLLAVVGGGFAGGGLAVAVRGWIIATNLDANVGYLDLVVAGGIVLGLGVGTMVAAVLRD